MTAKLEGREVVGVLGEIPVLVIEGKKPALRNNGDNTYSGQNAVSVDGLAAALEEQTPEHWRGLKIRCGHVRVRYTGGGEWLAWAGSNDGLLFGLS